MSEEEIDEEAIEEPQEEFESDIDDDIRSDDEGLEYDAEKEYDEDIDVEKANELFVELYDEQGPIIQEEIDKEERKNDKKAIKKRKTKVISLKQSHFFQDLQKCLLYLFSINNINEDEKTKLVSKCSTKINFPMLKLDDEIVIKIGNFIGDLTDMKIKFQDKNISVFDVNQLNNKRKAEKLVNELYDIVFLVQQSILGAPKRKLIENSLIKRLEYSENKQNEIRNLDWDKLVLFYITKLVIPEKKKYLENNQEEFVSLLIFLSPLLEKQREEEANIIAMQANEGIKQKGIYSCNKCGHDEHFIKIMQTRSGDEGPTTIVKCARCNFCFAEGR